MIQIGPAERRRRLAVRHRLAPGHLAEDPAQVARDLVALHATDPATVFLSIRARTSGPATLSAIEAALYQRRELIRLLGMRRTVFVVPAASVPVVQRSTSDRIAVDQRKLLTRLLREAGDIAAPDPWLEQTEAAVLRALAARGGSATATELTAALPALRTQLLLAPGKAYETRTNVTGRLLFVLAAEGKLIRGRPAGSWLSQQYRWWLTEHWMPESAGPAGEPLTEAAARAELARQWLAAFGPAPLTDLKWWTGWTMGQVRQAVADLKVTEVDLGPGAGTGVVLSADLEPTADPGPWVALLPALDPTVMGWAERSWFLGPHAAALFDKTGNAGPTIWMNGRVAGGWAQRPDGELVTRLLADTGADAVAMIEAEASRVRDWLGDLRVTPRFRTPTERELSA